MGTAAKAPEKVPEEQIPEYYEHSIWPVLIAAAT